MSYRDVFGVVGNGQVFVTPLPSCLRHLFQTGETIACSGMSVEIPPNVFQSDQLRQPVFLGRFYFTQVLSQLWFNVRETNFS